MNKKSNVIFITGAILVILFILAVFGIKMNGFLNTMDEESQQGITEAVSVGEQIKPGEETLDTRLDVMREWTKIRHGEKTMGQIQITDTNLYDELPEITKYPLQVEGNGDIDIEIFTSGEKAGKDTDRWMIEVAEDLNRSNLTLPDGQSVSCSVRSIGSGLGADYILSGKAVPDLYNPSNELFGDYAIANGAPMEIIQNRLVGNTAGILVRKNTGYDTPDDIINAVLSGELHLGYTNPQNSATGINLLLYLLQQNGGVDSEDAKTALQNFNANVPFIAHTTQQMTTSAANGSFDSIVSEYQAYINDQNLTNLYKFIPFGLRHDNPVYITDKANKDAARKEAALLVLDYMNSEKSQNLAAKYGFNANDDYVSSYSTYGAEVGRALNVYKQAKDAGKDIIAVFVADCSGSMNGTRIMEMKQSLSNGMQYINENNLIGLVSYSNEVTIELKIDRFNLDQKAYFQGAIDRMQGTGSTYSYEALCVAMDMIRDAQQLYPDAKPMIFLLSDGESNGYYNLSDMEDIIKKSSIPIYTIAYTEDADASELKELSGINEAANIKAGSDDIIYEIKSLFNSKL